MLYFCILGDRYQIRTEKTKTQLALWKSRSLGKHNYDYAKFDAVAMASSKFLAMALLLVVVGITCGAIFLSSGISVPYSSSVTPQSAVTRTSLVLETVNLTHSYTTLIPQTVFHTVTVTTTSTFTNSTGTTRTFNSTEVTTDMSDSTSTVTTLVVKSLTTSISYTSIAIQTDVIVKTVHARRR